MEPGCGPRAPSMEAVRGTAVTCRRRAGAGERQSRYAVAAPGGAASPDQTRGSGIQAFIVVDCRQRPSRLHPAGFRDLRCRTQSTGRPVFSFSTTTRARRRASSIQPRPGTPRSSQYFTFFKIAFQAISPFQSSSDPRRSSRCFFLFKNAFFIFDQRLPLEDILC